MKKPRQRKALPVFGVSYSGAQRRAREAGLLPPEEPYVVYGGKRIPLEYNDGACVTQIDWHHGPF